MQAKSLTWAPKRLAARPSLKSGPQWGLKAAATRRCRTLRRCSPASIAAVRTAADSAPASPCASQRSRSRTHSSNCPSSASSSASSAPHSCRARTSASSSGTIMAVRQPTDFLLRRMSPNVWSPK